MHITCAGVSTHYQHLGRRGSLVVLLHGWGCTWEVFSPIISELTRQYQLIIPDLPAFGQSALPGLNAAGEAWSSRDYLAWLQDFLAQTVKGQDYVIGGHSFGGKLAALLAAQNTVATARLKGLILIDAAGLPDPLTPKEQLAYTVSGLVPNFIKQSLPIKLKQRILAQAQVANDYQAASVDQQAVLRKIVREDLREILPQIVIPTLVCWGALDSTTPLHQGQAFAATIPGAQLEIFDQSQHYPFVDQPAKFIGAMEAFISQVTAA